MRAILRKKKCYAAIKRSNVLPTLLPALEVLEGLFDHARKNAITAKQEREGANEKIQEKIDIILEQRDDTVYYIMMNVREHIVHHISAMFDPHLMWKESETLFAFASEDRHELLRQKLSNLSTREVQFIKTHMRVVRNLTNQLSNCNETVKDSELIPLILMSLLTSWSGFPSFIKASIVHNPYTLSQFFTDEEMSRDARFSRTGVSAESLIAITQRSRQDKQQYHTEKRRSVSFQRSNNDLDYNGSDQRSSSIRDHIEFHNRHASCGYSQNYSPQRYTNNRNPPWRFQDRSYNRNSSSQAASPSIKPYNCNECGELVVQMPSAPTSERAQSASDFLQHSEEL